MPTGYSFNNYTVPENEWGTIVTADDMRITYMFGIDAVAQDINETPWEDSQFDYFVDLSLAEFERFLTTDIRKRIYKTRTSRAATGGTGLEGLTRGRRVGPGVDYTDLENPYPYVPRQWRTYGFLQLRHYPILSVERAVLNNAVGSELIDLLGAGWLRPNHEVGQLNFFPQGRTSLFTPFGGAISQRLISYGPRYPAGYEIDYTTGFESSDYVPDDLRSVIGKYAAIKALASIGDGLLAGFSSQSVSLDGLSESFSSTQSATSAYFGARIKQYQDETRDWLKANRHKFGAIPMAFVD